MSVHYKFKSALEYDTVTFDGLHISVKDLKKAIIHQKRIGKNTDFDLQVTNAQTKEVYSDENALIPKNTSLIIARIPLASQSKGKPWEGYGNSVTPSGTQSRPEEGALSKAVDLTQLDASEDDKIRAMMTQSTLDYDPSNYMKIRGSNQVGAVPSHYRCFKCHQPGHWIKDCPLGHGQEPVEIKKSTGIPRSFMVPVEGPMVPGAMMTPTGQYAVPVLDHQAYTEGTKPVQAPAQDEKPEIPEDLVCSICKDLLTDAVMIPCCGNSFCDECIRTILLESEDHECPDCHEKEISPGTLIPNRFLRNSVSNFKNETGYAKRIIYRPPIQCKHDDGSAVQELQNAENPTGQLMKKEEIIPDSLTSTNPNQNIDKPIISEADSTETKVSGLKEDGQEKSSKRDTHQNLPDKHIPTSPKHSLKYKAQPISSLGGQINHHRVHSSHTRLQSAGMEQQRGHNGPPGANLGPQYSEERPGTPTVDEPGMGPPGYSDYGDRSPNRPTTLPPMHQNMMSNQGPPGQPPFTNIPPGGFPPPNGPQQGFRMPPPGHPDYNRLPMISSVDPSVPPPSVPPTIAHQGYGPPPRQIFDPNRPPVPFDPLRPPVHGPPPAGYPPFQGGSRPPRGGGYPPSRHAPPIPPGGIRAPQITGVIDDPLEAFNRMLREKDERDRRARQARRSSRSRSYSRSRSRSRSSRSFSRSPRRRTRSPTPPRRHRSRTRSPPPRRRTRSKSRSFSMSRSRSFSRSPSFRGSPPRERDYSPRRRPPSRYRSPPRNSPPPRYNRYKDRPPLDRDRDRERDRDRDHPPRDRDRGERDRDRDRGDRDRMPERDYYQGYQDGPPQDYDNQGYDNRNRRGANGPPHQNNFRQRYPPRKEYQHQHPPMQSQNDQGFYGQQNQQDMVHPPQAFNNRFNQNRGPQNYPPPLMSVKAAPPLAGEPGPPRRYEDIGPPGLEQPPPPGFENTYNDRYNYDGRNRDEGPPGVDKFNKNSPLGEREEKERNPREQVDNKRERERSRERERKYSQSPDRSVSPRRERDRERHERRKHESSERDKDRERDRKEKGDSDREKKEKRKDRESEEEKVKRSKEKKRKKAEKKEAERKRKKEKKEKKEQERLKKAEERKAREENNTTQENLEEDKLQQESLPPKKEIEPKEEIIKENGDDDKKKVDLYDDILTEGIDNNVVAKYGKINEEPSPSQRSPPKKEIKETKADSEEKETSFDGIEIQVDEMELKSDFIENPKSKSEFLAPVPELSKWEREEDLTDKSDKSDPKQIFDRPSKVVTSEVIKRAENAIFAKAINAIRPIEIKKISLDRAKLYSGEKGISSPESNQKEIKNIQVTIPGPAYEEENEVSVEEVKIIRDNNKERKTPPPNKLSVKERLGCKVEELDKITRDDNRFDRNRSRTLSPLSRRQEDMSRNTGMGDRRVERIEIDDRRRYDDRRRHDRDRRHRDRSRSREMNYRGNYRSYDNRNRREEARRDRSRSRTRHNERSHDRHRQYHEERRPKEEHESKSRQNDREREKERRDKRSRSRSESRENKKRESRKQKEKKHKRDKDSKDKRSKHRSEERESSKVESKVIVQERKSLSKEKQPDRAKINEDRRKTLDEANFEPDYDLESESEKENTSSKPDQKRDRSKSPDIESVSKKKKTEDEVSHKKHSHSSSSESSESSEEEKPRKRHRKHKKKKSKKDTSSNSSDSDSDSSVEEKKRKKHKSKKQKKKKKSKHK